MSRERARSLVAAFRLWPFEWVAVGMAVVALGFLRARGLHYGWNTVAWTFPPLLAALPRLLVVGLALRGAQTLLARRSLRDYLRAFWRPDGLVLWLRCWLSAMLLVYTYTWLKVSIPLVRTALYDPQLWRLDRWLHFGVSPSIFAIAVVAETPAAGWLDRWYALWVPMLSILMAYFFAQQRADLRRNFALAAALLWTIGAWIYLAVPALGPCFASPELLEPIRERIPHAVGTQAGLWQHYLMMVRGRGGELGGFQPFFGVAALPSLHVGAHALVAFWARRHERWLVLPAAIATGLTFLGSLVTGWHYAVDGYLGLALAWLAVLVADRFEPVAAAIAAPAASPSSGSIAP